VDATVVWVGPVAVVGRALRQLFSFSFFVLLLMHSSMKKPDISFDATQREGTTYGHVIAWPEQVPPVAHRFQEESHD